MTLLIGLGMLITGSVLPNQLNEKEHRILFDPPISQSDLKNEAFKILDSKCNVCHRKQNPLMIFKEKNMERRAAKIYSMVFVKNRMPMGNEIQLTAEEYETLEKWLLTQKLL